ncbi:hypothetical protein C8Q76DRAFT_684104 [Earliella scabrosa]|nr:hypothetical protein C8Q76DRAFT_684104 [Earliella scabrosa]
MRSRQFAPLPHRRTSNTLTMSSPVTHTPAPSPFDKPSADIILRTSDHVDYHVHSQILIVASSVFEMILSLPHTPEPDGQTTSGRPIIAIEESSKVIEVLLRIVYPLEREVTSRTLGEVEGALKAALKYDVELAIAVLKTDFRTAAANSSLTLDAYAAACRLGLEDLARYAAKYSISHGAILRSSTEFQNSEGVNAGCYYRLREYQRLRGKVGSDFTFLTPPLLPPSETPPERGEGASDRNFNPHDHLPHMPFPDLICRSSDELEFRVHRGIVAAASPVFATIVQEAVSTFAQTSEASPPPDDNTPLPVLQVDERGPVLAAILRMCYPSMTKLSASPEDFADIFSATRKYAMDKFGRKIQKRWRDAAQSAPLRSYFIAVRTGWPEGAEDAARILLDRELEGLYTPEMEHCPPLVYDKLLGYHSSLNTFARESVDNVFIEDKDEMASYQRTDLRSRLSFKAAAKSFPDPDKPLCNVDVLMDVVSLLPQRFGSRDGPLYNSKPRYSSTSKPKYSSTSSLTDACALLRKMTKGAARGKDLRFIYQGVLS